MLIIHANIITMEAQDFLDGYVWVENAKIKQLGDMKQRPAVGAEVQVVDLAGATLLPGLVDGHCHLGMWEDGLGFEGDDGNEASSPSTPQMLAIDAINPFDYCFEEARNAGVTTVVTGPGSANPISGYFCAVKTNGVRIDQMLVEGRVGMKFALGENPKTTYHAKGETPQTRMGVAACIREELYKAKRYLLDQENAEQDEEVSAPDFDAKSEALLPVLMRKCKAFFHAHRADDIFTAVRIAKEFSLDYVIVHGTEGHKIASLLAEEQAPVLAGPVLCDRSKPELKEASIKNVPTLDRHGVKVAICTDHPVVPIQYLALSGGLCVREGLDLSQALRMMTIVPAEICGIDHRVGSIAVGKDADFVVVRDDICSVYSKVCMVMIQGEIVYQQAD